MSRDAKWIWKADTPATRAGRRPDLGREVRQGGEVVADQGRRRREAVAGELYPVARVARKPDDDALFLLGGLFQIVWLP